MAAFFIRPDKTIGVANGGKWYGRTVKNVLENSLYQTVGAGERG
jgi:hypothetical protein